MTGTLEKSFTTEAREELEARRELEIKSIYAIKSSVSSSQLRAHKALQHTQTRKLAVQHKQQEQKMYQSEKRIPTKSNIKEQSILQTAGPARSSSIRKRHTSSPKVKQ